MSLINSLGSDYFTQFFRQGLFVYEGRVLEIVGVNNNHVLAYERSTGNEVRVPNAFFTGFKVFEYPSLGYRRFNDTTVGYVTKVQSAYRGLRTSQIDVAYSPTTRAIADSTRARAGVSKETMASELMKPTFNTMADLPKLLEGDITGLVLNEAVLIEPSLTQDNAGFNIFYKQARIGKMSAAGVASWYNDKHNKYISSLLEAA